MIHIWQYSKYLDSGSMVDTPYVSPTKVMKAMLDFFCDKFGFYV
jgi:hypothetical protein